MSAGPRTALAALSLACAPAHGGQGSSSADYTVTPDALDFGGGKGSVGLYSHTGGFGETGGTSGAPAGVVSSRGGYAGQLYEILALLISSAQSAIPEGSTVQLSATARLDDLTILPVPAESVSWRVVSGPFTGVSLSGLATAGPVTQSAAAILGGSYAGVSGVTTVDITDFLMDNFGPYAADGISDSWQALHFGENDPDSAAPGADPDSDGVSNLLEYAFGMHPAQNNAAPVSYTGDSQVSPGVPAAWVAPSPTGVDHRAVFSRRKQTGIPTLFYTVQFSADMAMWQNSTAVPDIRAAGPDVEAVSVRYPLFLSNGRKARFFRVKVDTLPFTP